MVLDRSPEFCLTLLAYIGIIWKLPTSLVNPAPPPPVVLAQSYRLNKFKKGPYTKYQGSRPCGCFLCSSYESQSRVKVKRDSRDGAVLTRELQFEKKLGRVSLGDAIYQISRL